MSVQLVESEIKRFLITDDAEVICISGHWGVGKTYAWNRFLRDAQRTKGGISLKRYSYVSLFGVTSLEELKYSIFQNTVQSSMIGSRPSVETVRVNLGAVAEQLGRKSLSFFQQLPIVTKYVGNVSPAWFLWVSDTIICFDDIERAGATLNVRDILGLASQLKEQKRCKVILILNDEALASQTTEFRKYFEKVIDVSLKFVPTTAESTQIALDVSTEPGKAIAEHCVNLGIANIRVIKKIERSVLKVAPLLGKFNQQIMTQAIQTLVLLGWCVYEPERAPSIEHVQKRGTATYSGKDKAAISDNEAAWNALLDSYGFRNMDQLDSVLLDGVRNGFFNESLLLEHASALDEEIKSSKSNQQFIDAWEMFHDSLANNQDEVLEAMYKSALQNLGKISPMNLSSTVSLFKELGRAAQATDIIDQYVAAWGGEKLQSLERGYEPVSGEVKDAELAAAIEKAKRSLKLSRPDPVGILKSIKRGWNPDDISFLSTLTADEYYKIFKDARGDDLRQILNGCLQFDRIANASEEMKEIPKRAREALDRIGRESEINAIRVKRYGVEVQLNDGKTQG